VAGASNCEVVNVQILDNAGYGVYIYKNARDCMISSNKITGNLRGVSVRSTVKKMLLGGASSDIMVEEGAQNIRLSSNETGN